MIKNEREYKITRATIERFEKILAHLSRLHEESKIDPRKIKLQEAATLSVLEELRDQLREYDELRLGKFELAALDLVRSLPSNLIKARIALGWTQKDLAKRLGTTEQQIQKYEATDYESASLRRIAEIVSVIKAETVRGKR